MYHKIKNAEERLATEALRTSYSQGGEFPSDVIWISMPHESVHYCYKRDVLLQHFAESGLAWEADTKGKAKTNARVFKIPHPDIWLSGEVRKELRQFRGRRYVTESLGTKTIVTGNLQKNEVQRSKAKVYKLTPYA
jgi:hypothetical protein